MHSASDVGIVAVEWFRCVPCNVGVPSFDSCQELRSHVTRASALIAPRGELTSSNGSSNTLKHHLLLFFDEFTMNFCPKMKKNDRFYECMFLKMMMLCLVYCHWQFFSFFSPLLCHNYMYNVAHRCPLGAGQRWHRRWIDGREPQNLGHAIFIANHIWLFLFCLYMTYMTSIILIYANSKYVRRMQFEQPRLSVRCPTCGACLHEGTTQAAQTQE